MIEVSKKLEAILQVFVTISNSLIPSKRFSKIKVAFVLGNNTSGLPGAVENQKMQRFYLENAPKVQKSMFLFNFWNIF